MYVVDNGAGDIQLSQLFPPTVAKTSSTSIEVTINTLGMIEEPTSFSVIYQKVTSDYLPAGLPITINSQENPVYISGLTANSYYKITTQASTNTLTSGTMTVYYQLSGTAIITPAATGGKTGVSSLGNSIEGNGTKISAKSYLVLNGGTPTDKKYGLAYRNFDAIDTSSGRTINLNSTTSVKTYDSPVYYAFGTSILLSPNLDKPNQGGGIGFFVSSGHDAGYFVTVETTSSAASTDSKAIKIIKVVGKNSKVLTDTQTTPSTSLDAVFGGKIYDIDIKVKISGFKTIITAYINGFKITATDTTSAAAGNIMLPPSKNIALVGVSGTSMFDYVYASSITEQIYNSTIDKLNFYKGQFSNDIIDTLYGDIIYNSNNNDPENILKPSSFDEFGTVVREIAHQKIRFSNRPSIPIAWNTGGNSLVKILAESRSSFDAEVFVLNNSSVSVPLSDNGANKLSIFGNDIAFSGEVLYETDPVSEYANKEPITFQTNWIQNENDAKSLAEWIKKKVINRAKIIKMQVFGNPLISIGDVVIVNYSYQGMDSNQKLLVTGIVHTFSEGLETEIICRTL